MELVQRVHEDATTAATQTIFTTPYRHILAHTGTAHTGTH